jgi:hypothetical protein
MPKPLKPREVFERLRKHDDRFEVFFNQGKGSHVMIRHPNVERQGGGRSMPKPQRQGRQHRVTKVVDPPLSAAEKDFRLRPNTAQTVQSTTTSTRLAKY